MYHKCEHLCQNQYIWTNVAVEVGGVVEDRLEQMRKRSEVKKRLSFLLVG